MKRVEGCMWSWLKCSQEIIWICDLRQNTPTLYTGILKCIFPRSNVISITLHHTCIATIWINCNVQIYWNKYLFHVHMNLHQTKVKLFVSLKIVLSCYPTKCIYTKAWDDQSCSASRCCWKVTLFVQTSNTF